MTPRKLVIKFAPLGGVILPPYYGYYVDAKFNFYQIRSGQIWKAENIGQNQSFEGSWIIPSGTTEYKVASVAIYGVTKTPGSFSRLSGGCSTAIPAFTDPTFLYIDGQLHLKKTPKSEAVRVTWKRISSTEFALNRTW